MEGRAAGSTATFKAKYLHLNIGRFISDVVPAS